jgi:hypothetical protein
MAADEFQMEIDPDSVIVAPVPMIPEINIASRQTVFFKDEQGWFIPKGASRPSIVNTCDQGLYNFRVVWHMPNQSDNPLPVMAQSLARQSDINLTMNVYTDVVMEDQAVAVELLPELPALLPPSEPTKAPSIHQQLAKIHEQAHERLRRKGANKCSGRPNAIATGHLNSRPL